MSRKYVGIEEGRKRLGDLVTAVQQGAEIILTRNGKPAARLIRHQEDTVTTYTVQIEASNSDQTIWQALEPAETVTALNGETARDIAEMVAGNQNIADGDNWRVLVWDGEDADTSATPAAEYYPGEAAAAITTTDLARELDISKDDVEMHVQQLVAMDGEQAVIVSQEPTGHHQGSYPIVITTITSGAAEAIRLIVAASTES